MKYRFRALIHHTCDMKDNVAKIIVSLPVSSGILEPKDQRHFFEKSDEKAAKRHIPNLYGGSLTLNISTCVFLNVLKGGLKLKGLV